VRKGLYIHDVTVWVPTGEPDIYGKDTYDREVIKARWEESRRTFTNTDGNLVTSNAVVYVKKSFPYGSLFKKGVDASVEPPQDAYKMERYQEIPNLRGTRVEREILL